MKRRVLVPAKVEITPSGKMRVFVSAGVARHIKSNPAVNNPAVYVVRAGHHHYSEHRTEKAALKKAKSVLRLLKSEGVFSPQVFITAPDGSNFAIK